MQSISEPGDAQGQGVFDLNKEMSLERQNVILGAFRDWQAINKGAIYPDCRKLVVFMERRNREAREKGLRPPYPPELATKPAVGRVLKYLESVGVLRPADGGPDGGDGAGERHDRDNGGKLYYFERPPGEKPSITRHGGPAGEAGAGAGAETGTGGANVAELPVELIDPPLLTRSRMGSVAALMGSIKSHGLLNPITVRPMKGGRYQVVCGYRRFSAIAALGWKRVPAIVRPDLAENDRLVYELIIAENEQRRTLTPLEEGRFFWEFSARFYERNMSLALSELARISGLSESTVSRRRALMLLPQELAALLETGELSLGDAEGFAQSVAKGFVSKQAMSELLGALPELKNRGNLVAILRAASLGPEALTLALHPKSSAMRTTPAAAATESGPRIQEAPHVYTAPAPAPSSVSGSAPPAAPPDQGAREVHPAPGTVPPGGLQEKRSRWSLDDWIPVGVLDNEFYCECGRGYVAVSSRRLILRKKDVADSAQNGKGER